MESTEQKKAAVILANRYFWEASRLIDEYSIPDTPLNTTHIVSYFCFGLECYVHAEEPLCQAVQQEYGHILMQCGCSKDLCSRLLHEQICDLLSFLSTEDGFEGGARLQAIAAELMDLLLLEKDVLVQFEFVHSFTEMVALSRAVLRDPHIPV